MDIKIMFRNTLSYLRGSFFINRMIGDNDTVYVLNNQHIGDICYALAFVESYRKANDTKDIKILWSGKLKEVYDAFTDAELYLVSAERQTDVLCYLSKSKKGRELVKDGRFIVTYTSYYMSSLQMEEQAVSVPELLASQAFGLDIKDSMSLPNVAPKDISAVIEKCGIKRNKTVIINPYALSMDLPLELFEYLSMELSKKGFIVLTNLNSKNGEPLSHSQGVWLSLSEMYHLAEYCGHLIGVRSGFFDFLISAKCNFTVFYDSKYSMKKAYSLDAWNTGNLLREYVIDSTCWKEKIDEVIDNLEKQI